MAWLKVDKELIGLWLGKDNDRLVWWIDMLDMAAWKDTGDLRKGQLTMSLSGLCQRWNTTKKKVRNFIDFLLKTGRITKDAGRSFSTITIVEVSEARAHRGHTEGTPKGTPRAQKDMCESASYEDEGHTEGTPKGTPRAHRGHINIRNKDNNNISLRDITTTPAPACARTCEEETGTAPGTGSGGTAAYGEGAERTRDGRPEPQRHDWYGLAEFFNRTMDEAGARIPRIKAVTDRRLTAVMARAREYGEGAVYEAVTRAARSPFLNGGGSRVFVADFDWIMRPNNFPKVLEGNYDEVFAESNPSNRSNWSNQNNQNNQNNQSNRTNDADSRTGSRAGNDAGYEQRRNEARALVARLLAEGGGGSPEDV